jgi:uncharacterized protein with ATP-grasp and redox domains
MYTKWTIETDEDKKAVFTKDNEVNNDAVDRLALKLSEHYNSDEVEPYAQFLISKQMKAYKEDIDEYVKENRKFSHIFRKFLKDIVKAGRCKK